MSAPFSILDIGRRINSLSVAYGKLDDDDSADDGIQPSDEHRPEPVQSKVRRCRQDQMNFLLAEMTLLRDLALIPQPQTLVEAAVQLALLFTNMGYELDTDDVEEMRTGFKKAYRTTAGLARAVAATASVDLAEFGETDMEKCPKPQDEQIAELQRRLDECG
jgi:hypothetical protein